MVQDLYLNRQRSAVHTCDPTGRDGRTVSLRHEIVKMTGMIEAELKGGNAVECTMLIGDKGGQNGINSLFTRKGGDAALGAYWDMLAGIQSLFRQAILEKHKALKICELPILRASNSSDETTIVNTTSGKIRAVSGSLKETKVIYEQQKARTRKYMMGNLATIGERRKRLIEYFCEIETATGTRQVNLRAMSQVLAHPEMILSSREQFSDPFLVVDELDQEILVKKLKELESSEIEFADQLPAGMFINNGMAEVSTPFVMDLRSVFRDKGETHKLKGGFVVDIKFKAQAACELLRFTADGWNEIEGVKRKGTRKGYFEIFNNQFGMRGFNTFIGKAGANTLLSVTAEAMGNIRESRKVEIEAVDGQLRYWIDDDHISGLEMEKIIVAEINRLLEKRVPGSAFRPKVKLKPAIGLEVSQVAERFELDLIGYTEKPCGTFEKTDFVINLIEMIDEKVKKELIDSIRTGNTQKTRIGENLRKLRRIAERRRTIRNTLDLISILRYDPELDIDGIRATEGQRTELESWFFNFSIEHHKQMFDKLIKKTEGLSKNQVS